MMFEITFHAPHLISSDVLLLMVFQEDKEKKASYIPSDAFTKLNTTLKKKLESVLTSDSFTGAKGESVSLFTQGEITASKVVVLGLGKEKEFVMSDLRNALGSYTKAVKEKITTLAIIPPTITSSTATTADLLHVFIEGIDLGNYQFAKYKAKKETAKQLETVLFVLDKTSNEGELNAAIERATLYTQATRLARDLVNEQPSIATPTYLATLAKDIAKSSTQISCQIFDHKEAEKMGMDAFLGIARAAISTTPPQFIFLSYEPKMPNKKRKLALVGKGITFDSGGMNVKPGEHMGDMKMDMAGGAIVLGVFSVIAQLQPSFPVIGLIAATPNLISATAVVPGEVVKAMNGKTIEILNTDAEGRVTMADSLSFAVKEKATEILDFATLTGAALYALGEEIGAVFSNNQPLLEQVRSAALTEGEKIWELPLDKDHKDLNKSEVADLANIPSTRYAGTMTAALFLEEFVDNTPWVHFDIAGPAFLNKAHALGPKGGTGFGVRTVLQLLEGKR